MSRVGEESSVDLHDPETGEVTECASLEMERSEKVRTSEDADGSVFLFSNEDSGLESDAHDNSEDLRTAEVSVSVEPRFQEQLTTGFSRDKKMRHIIQRIKRNPKLQDPYFWNAQEKKLYFLSDGVRRLCIPAGPPRLRLELLKLCYDVPSSGHPGRDRTYSRLARSYYWPRMSQYVKRFVRSCKKCQHSKGDRARQAPLQCLPVPSQPWQDISMDFITGLPVSSSGSNAVLTFIDRLTKQAHFVPTKTTVQVMLLTLQSCTFKMYFVCMG